MLFFNISFFVFYRHSTTQQHLCTIWWHTWTDNLRVPKPSPYRLSYYHPFVLWGAWVQATICLCASTMDPRLWQFKNYSKPNLARCPGSAFLADLHSPFTGRFDPLHFSNSPSTPISQYSHLTLTQRPNLSPDPNPVPAPPNILL